MLWLIDLVYLVFFFGRKESTRKNDTNKNEIKLVSKEVSKENLLPESIVDFYDDPTYYSQLLKYVYKKLE